MSKMWTEEDGLLPDVERFCNGDDWLYDNFLTISDCVGSIGHAQGLWNAEILTESEYKKLKRELMKIVKMQMSDQIVTTSDEDGHSAIEQRLIVALGDVGKKIHTGRSRNDQVFCALLLYGRDALFQSINRIHLLIIKLLELASREEVTPMVGRTHLQHAMPSSVGLWAGSYIELLLNTMPLAQALYDTTNQSPLGSAAGYGTTIKIDRKAVAKSLGFARPIQLVLSAINLRGHWESQYLDYLSHIALILSRLAGELLLYTLPELGYFSLPDGVATGSSIMPHKKNPDLLELMRARCGKIIGATATSKQMVQGLPGGYNRDLQELKPMLIDNIYLTWDLLDIATLTMSKLTVNRHELSTSLSKEIYSVDEIMRLVTERNISFRDAYHQIKAELDVGTFTVDEQTFANTLNNRTAFGGLGNLGLNTLSKRIESSISNWQKKKERVNNAILELVGQKIPFAAMPGSIQ